MTGAPHGPNTMYATTILCVRRDGEVAVVGDGQVTLGYMVMKPNAVKVRRIGPEGSVITGIAGATADCLTLRERLEQKLEECVYHDAGGAGLVLAWCWWC